MIVSRAASYLNRNGWLLNLVFIVMGSYFVAGAMNSVVARKIRVVPDVEDMVQNSNGGGPKGRVKGGIVFSTMAERNLFGAEREELNPQAVVEMAGEELEDSVDAEYDPNNLEPCSLPSTLRATLVADGDPESSSVVLYHTKNREAQVHSIDPENNRIDGETTLIEVGYREIIIQRGDHYERCTIDDTGKKKSRSSRSKKSRGPGSKSGPGTGGGTGVTRISETEFNIEKKEIDSVLGNLSSVATQARIVPSFKNGKPNGFKLFSIKPGSIYSKIGLRNGDVIQKVNGYEMNSPDKALEIYQKLKDAQNVTVDLQRRGRAMTMNYAIGS